VSVKLKREVEGKRENGDGPLMRKVEWKFYLMITNNTREGRHLTDQKIRSSFFHLEGGRSVVTLLPDQHDSRPASKKRTGKKVLKNKLCVYGSNETKSIHEPIPSMFKFKIDWSNFAP
jgi:hypothetical protein